MARKVVSGAAKGSIMKRYYIFKRGPSPKRKLPVAQFTDLVKAEQAAEQMGPDYFVFHWK